MSPVHGGLSLADYLGIASLVVALLGFGVALDQIRRLGRRTEAVQKAVETQRRAIAGALFLTRVSELETVERELLRAVGVEDATRSRSDVQRFVIEWRRTAIDAQSFLDATGSNAEPLDEALALSLGLVGLALERLGDQGVTPVDACSVLLQKVNTVCGLARAAANTMVLAKDA